MQKFLATCRSNRDETEMKATTAFITGLLHDIGKVVLVDAITTKYTGNVGRLNSSPTLLAKAINHFAPLIGLHVIQHWNLASELTFSTLFSQHPEHLVDEAPHNLSYCIQLASDMAESKGYGIFDPDQIQLEGHQTLSYFEIS
jgi:HD-like signal output (HDOD) protein